MSLRPPPLTEKNFNAQAWTTWFQSVAKDYLQANPTANRMVYADSSEVLRGIATLSSWIGSSIGITVIDDGDGSITINIKRQTHESDASTSHAITDPADSPASADVLRDDLVANTIPSIETALNALGTKINNILSKLESAEVLLSS